MKILHYTLGLPPQRSGGLTKYATDLMLRQSGTHQVSLLYPGRMLFFSKERSIRSNPTYENIAVYELCNPVLVPLLYGVSNPQDIVTDKKQLLPEVMEWFCQKVNPDIFHIHTWMGMPIELIAFLKEKRVKIVYTTHDYYGLCPKANFINEQQMLCFAMHDEVCRRCNNDAPSSFFLRVRNSRIVLHLKNNRLLRRLLLYSSFIFFL
jgi:hypothetical protein